MLKYFEVCKCNVANTSAAKTRFVLFFDGTGNDSRAPSNVFRLWKLTASQSPDAVVQKSRYWPGVGSQDYQRVKGSPFGYRIRTATFGYGMSERMQQAYRWLAQEHKDGDEIFVFGFSRGAFTAMGFLGFLAWTGLPRSGIPADLDFAERQFLTYRNATQASREGLTAQEQSKSLWQLEKSDPTSVEAVTRLKRFRSVSVTFAGVFDTVRAAGEEVLWWCGTRLPPEVPENIKVGSSGTLALRYTRHLAPNVLRGFHALAVDEHRAVFHPRVWIVAHNESDGPKLTEQIEQRWFIGAHADVGGGYKENHLDRLPLRWMQERAKEAGLCFTPEQEQYVDRDAYLRASPTDSWADWRHPYRLANWRRFIRPIFAFQEPRPGIEYARQRVDSSVLERVLAVECYKPENVAAWLRREHAFGRIRPGSLEERCWVACFG